MQTRTDWALRDAAHTLTCRWHSRGARPGLFQATGVEHLWHPSPAASKRRFDDILWRNCECVTSKGRQISINADADGCFWSLESHDDVPAGSVRSGVVTRWRSGESARIHQVWLICRRGVRHKAWEGTPHKRDKAAGEAWVTLPNQALIGGSTPASS